MPALQEGAATALVISPYGALAREFGRRLAAKGYGVRLATDPMQALYCWKTSRRRSSSWRGASCPQAG